MRLNAIRLTVRRAPLLDRSPVLVANYVDTWLPMGDTARGMLSVGIVALVTTINLLGTDVMVKFNTLLALVSLAPTLIFTFYGLPELKPLRCLQSEGEVDWSLLVSWILWLYCGFFSLGTLAGELERPRETFLCSIAILFPAVLILNTLPLAVALGLDQVASHYTAGYFNVLARRLAGGWLDWAFQLGANVCLVGLYNAAIITAERSLFFLVNCHYAETIQRVVSGEGQGKPCALITNWLFSASKTGVAPIYILTNAACASVLVWMPYTLLVEFSMLLSVPSILLFMWSFVALRVQRPDTPRPFRIPGGLSTAVLITVVPVAISISYGAIVATESLIGRPSARVERRSGRMQPIHQVYSMFGVILVGILAHAIISRMQSDERQQAEMVTKPELRGCVLEPHAGEEPGVEDETELLNGGDGAFSSTTVQGARRPVRANQLSGSPLGDKLSRVVTNCLKRGTSSNPGYLQVPSET